MNDSSKVRKAGRRNPTWAGVLQSMIGTIDEPEIPCRSGCWVYFAHYPELRRVKIGTSTSPERRIASLHYAYRELRGFEVRLAGLIDGGLLVERLIHEKFSRSRIAGEWFNDEILPRLERMVEQDRDHYGLDTLQESTYGKSKHYSHAQNQVVA